MNRRTLITAGPFTALAAFLASGAVPAEVDPMVALCDEFTDSHDAWEAECSTQDAERLESIKGDLLDRIKSMPITSDKGLDAFCPLSLEG